MQSWVALMGVWMQARGGNGPVCVLGGMGTTVEGERRWRLGSGGHGACSLSKGLACIAHYRA